MTPRRLSPEREAEIRENWEGACTDQDELLSEIDAVRKELRNEQQFSDNILADVLSSLSLFICTPERGYKDTATLIPLDIERIGKERDALRAENEKLRETLRIIDEGIEFTDSKKLGIKLLSIAQIKQLIKEALS